MQKITIERELTTINSKTVAAQINWRKQSGQLAGMKYELSIEEGNKGLTDFGKTRKKKKRFV